MSRSRLPQRKIKNALFIVQGAVAAVAIAGLFDYRKVLDWLDGNMNSLWPAEIEIETVTIFFTGFIICVFALLFLVNLVRALFAFLKIRRLRARFASLAGAGSAQECAGILAEYPLFRAKLIVYGNKYYLNQDAESASVFILDPPFLRSAWFPAGPAFLTGIGVLGTFIGLLLGLRGLNLAGGADSLAASIGRVADGASTAFITSVYGVGASLILTIIEKSLTSFIRERYRSFQELIDAIFPPLPFGAIFIDMRDEMASVKSSLADLPDQINQGIGASLNAFGDRLLASMASGIADASSKLSGALADTLKSDLSPAIQSISGAATELANKQAKGSEEILARLIEDFTAGAREAGEKQQEAMARAVSDMREAMQAMAGKMEAIALETEARNQKFGEEQAKRLDELKNEFMELSRQSEANLNKEREAGNAMLSAFQSSLKEGISAQAADMSRIALQFGESMAALGANIEGFFAELDQKQADAAQAAKEQAGLIDGQLKQVFERQAQTLAAMERKLAEQAEAGQRLLDRQREDNAQAAKEQAEYINAQMEQIFMRQSEALAQMEERFAAQLEGSEAIMSQARALHESVKEYGVKFQEIAGHLGEGSANLRQASAQLAAFGQEIREALDAQLDNSRAATGALRDAASVAENVANDLASALKAASELRDGLLGASESVAKASEDTRKDLAGVAQRYQELQKRLEEHMQAMRAGLEAQISAQASNSRELRERMEEHLKAMQAGFERQSSNLAVLIGKTLADLDKQTEALLAEFGQRLSVLVNQRMDEWYQQTRNFSKTMEGIVHAIADIVDEIESKTGR